ncbi:MAG: hypothetical protein QXH91_03575 [Candidatus Bathyarchaeia archaeon]
MVYFIISPCSKSKDDSIPILSDFKNLTPYNYIHELSLAKEIIKIREKIFQDPRARVGSRETYAFNLYIRAGKAYSKVYCRYYPQLKNMLLKGEKLCWFFLSGGYGIINALEKARKYQASFNKNLAYKNGIPYTTPLWNPILKDACNSIFRKFEPQYVYVFGSRDYTQFIKDTERWRKKDHIKIFESIGQSGSQWIAEILFELVGSLKEESVEDFNRKYLGDFIRQRYSL